MNEGVATLISSQFGKNQLDLWKLPQKLRKMSEKVLGE